MRRGFFITFEGGDRSGKTTQIDSLRVFLEGKGFPCLLTREPGGTVLGEKIRGLLLDTMDEPPDHMTEALLFAASRAHLVSRVIEPALAGGRTVICDRFADSTLAYQGYGLGMDPEFLALLNRGVTGGLVPDLTFLLDVDPAETAARWAGSADDRISRRDLAFHRRVRHGYLELARLEPHRFCVIDARAPVEAVEARVRSRCEELLHALL